MSPDLRIRAVVSRLPAGLLIVAALVGFWLLSRKSGGGGGATSGYAEARLHQVGPLQAGRLQVVLVRLGEQVRAGQELARLDNRPLSLSRDRLLAELRQTESQLAAERDLQLAQMERGELQVLRSKSTEERARAELEQLDLQLQRLEGLRAQQLVRATEVEEVQRQRQALAAELQVRAQAARAQGPGRRVHTQAEQQARLELRLAPLRAEVKVREAALREVEHAIEQATLRAPVDGLVGAIAHRAGDAVLSGAPILTVIEEQKGRVEAFVPEPRARSLQVGATAELRRTGIFGGALRGQVVELSPHVEEVPPRARPAPTVPVWARRVVIQVEGGALLPGESFYVSLP